MLGRRQRQGLQGWLFILPAVVMLLVFLVYPVLWTLRLSLDTGRGLRFQKFVGLENYITLLTKDRLFMDLQHWPPSGAVVNNLLWVALFVPLCVGLGLLIAVLANRVRYEALVKAVVFLPMAISATAVGIIWLFVYSPDAHIGILNAILTHLSSGAQPIAWLGRANTVNIAIIVATVWASTGLPMVVLSAALKGIPREVVEAAHVDGANEWQVFRSITLPMISLPISVVTVTLLINVIKVFDVIYVMTKGGPRGVSRVIAYSMFTETFENGKGGYGAAVAVIMLLLVIPIMVTNIRRFRAERVIK